MPQFETTTNGIRFALRQTIAVGNAALDRLGALKPREVTFENTVRALDDIGYQISLTDDRFGLIKETSTNAALRDAATDALKELEEWTVGIDYREDVYKALKAYADRKPKLKGEDAKLLAETMRDYRRAGLDLPKAQRDEVERMRKELTRLTTDFESNITKAQKAVKFTQAELEGVPESFLAQVKTGADEYTVMANITWHYLSVMDNAKREETRKKLLIEHDNLARAENIPLLEKILPLRDDIARKLGYKTWADYQIEVKMAKNAATAIDFLEKLKTGLQPKFDAELAEFRQLKVKETGDTNAQIRIWDWRYFSNQLKKEKYNVDAEQLRVYFPYQRVLDGMFSIYQTHLRPQVRAGRAALQMDWRPAALRRLRRQDRRAARAVLPRHVPARRQIQSLRPVPPHRGQAAGQRQIPAPDRRPDLQLPLAHQGQALAALA